jgi:hypothetical protein
MDPRRDDLDLVAELRALRPSPTATFAADLDARAAAGFPRHDAERPARVRNLIERLHTTPPRRLLAPAGACAVAAIVVVTAVVAISEDQPTSVTLDDGPSGSAQTMEPSNSVGSRLNEAAVGVPPSKAKAGTDSSGVQPSSGVEYSGGAAQLLNPNRNSGYAAEAGRREIERSAQIVLGTDPERVRADAAKVFDAVHAVDGIVLRSSIRDGAAGVAGARFELLIPSGRLGDAMADFSAIGEVRSRRESTQDITAPTIGARERLQDSRATIEGLLDQLAAATTDAERTATEAKLRAERRQAAFFAAQLDRLSRRANLSRVSLRIETGAAATSEDGSGAWGVGDGLDDAGRILEIAAGVTIVGLAILAPIALIAILAWLVHRAWIRVRREQALR